MRSIIFTIAALVSLVLTGCATVNVSEYQQGCRDGATEAIKRTNNEPLPDGINRLCKDLDDANHSKLERQGGHK